MDIGPVVIPSTRYLLKLQGWAEQLRARITASALRDNRAETLRAVDGFRRILRRVAVELGQLRDDPDDPLITDEEIARLIR